MRSILPSLIRSAAVCATLTGCPGDDSPADDTAADTAGSTSTPGTSTNPPTTSDTTGPPPATTGDSTGTPPSTSSDSGGTTSGGSESDDGSTTGGSLACGEGAEECAAAHAAFAACGGDPTGTWTISGLCTLPVTQQDPMCAGHNYSLGVVTGSGDVEFDGEIVTYTNYVVDEYGASETPAECIFPPGGTCADVETITLMQWDEACCEDVAGVCSCQSRNAGMSQDFSGAYLINGNELSVQGVPQEFCVSGDVLQILSGPPGMPGSTLTTLDRVP